jgi:hypothetical protein
MDQVKLLEGYTRLKGLKENVTSLSVTSSSVEELDEIIDLLEEGFAESS